MAIEEQTTYSSNALLGSAGDAAREWGQRLTISNRQVTKLGFWLRKRNTPIGTLTFLIRKVSDGEVICSKLWGNSSDLPAETTYLEVEFDTPQTINEEVRIVAFAQGETAEANGAYIGYERESVKDDEYTTLKVVGAWTDKETWETAYRYTYTAAFPPTVTTQAITEASGQNATGNGNLTDLGSASVTAHGHCWNTTGTPTLEDEYKDNGAKGDTGDFTTPITGLLPGTTYYFRAFATNEYGTSYGNEVTLSSPLPPTAPGLYSKFWAWVDWNDDGDFADDYETITDDVVEIPSITWGKPRELAEVVPASIQLIVDNFTHKYSPPNTNSVLNTGDRTLRPGHAIMVGASFPWDEFTDTDAVTLTNHTVMWDSSYAWTEQSGAWVINTNKVKESGGSGGIATLDFEEPNAQVQVEFTKGADDDGILVLRYKDADNYLYVRTTATDLELRKVSTAGGDELLDGETFAWTVGHTKTVKVVLHGEFIWVIVNLTQIIPAIRRTSGALLSSTFNETETKHGIGGPSTHTNSRWDNFGGVYSLFSGTIDNIVPMPSKERQTALITASDNLKILHRTKFFRRAYARGGYPAGMKAYIEEILEQLPVYTGRGELLDWGENVTTNPYKSWWRVTALDVCHDIEKEENGFFYQDQDGIFRFEAKGHRAASPHDASRCTLYDTYTPNNLYFSNLKWDAGERDVRNLVSVHVEKSVLDNDTKIGVAGTDGAIIWRCKEADVVDDPNVDSSALAIPASDSIVIFFETKDYDTITDLINPTVTPDVYKVKGAILDGPFLIGETVIGYVSGNTGEVMEQGADYILLGNCSGAFNVADSFGGTDSLAYIQGGADTYVVKGTITNGPFVRGEHITTDVSGKTAEVQAACNIGLILVQCSGAFNAGDTFTGGTSGATLNGSATLIAQYGVTITLMKDYMANASADGSGADKTSDLTVTLAYPFYNSYGKGGRLTLANGDTSPIYVTRLVVRGRGYKLQPRGSAFAEDAASQAAYGEQSEDIEAKVLLTLAEAQTLADDIKTKEATPRAKVLIEMKRGTKENLIKMLSLKLSDRITLNYSGMGVNEAFFINKFEYRLAEAGLDFACVLTLEEEA